MIDPAAAPGSRVVLRYQLPPGSAHAMTDVVGVLLARSPVTVRDKRGRVVEVAEDQVVALRLAGPPTIPKAAIRSLECAMADGWPGTEQQWLDGWLLRVGGPAPGANSAAPLDNPLQTPAVLERIERWYQRRLLRPQLVLPARLAPLPAGWVHDHEIVVMVANIAELVLPAGKPALHIAALPGPAWLAAYAPAGAPVPSGLETLLPLVRNGLVAFGSLGAATPMAIGRVAITIAPGARCWAGLTAIRVAPQHRRRGLASLLSGELLRWSVAHGATHSYVTVNRQNEPALRLYESMGFVEHHRHWYAVK